MAPLACPGSACCSSSVFHAFTLPPCPEANGGSSLSALSPLAVHCGSIRQTATILSMDKDCLRTGDKATVHFRFIKTPEYLHIDQRLVFREGRTKAVGTITKVWLGRPHLPPADTRVTGPQAQQGLPERPCGFPDRLGPRLQSLPRESWTRAFLPGESRASDVSGCWDSHCWGLRLKPAQTLVPGAARS